MHNKILCGLDIGTNSVGWCLTDENNKIIRKQGKALWGVRMFDEASSCAERRTNRSNRRRLNRRRERIDLLRIQFVDEINKVDPTFFERLDNSFYQKEDRVVDFDYTLFNDRNYSDKDFYKKYPTIYHLRQSLLNEDKKQDIRLVYLAFHHMVKYRGNFLNNSEVFKPMDPNEAAIYFESLINTLPNYLDGETIRYDQDTFNRLVDANKGKVTISSLKEKMNEIINPDGNKYIKEVVIPLIAGGKVAVKKLNLDNIEELDFKDICVKDEKFDVNISSLLSIDKDKEDLINCFIDCKNIFQFFLLGRLIDDSKYLSDAMVKRYDLHHAQLKQLKAYVRTNCPDKYNLIFRDVLKYKDKKKNCNYVKYIGSNLINGIKTTFSHCTPEEFYNFLKDILNLKGFRITEENKNSYEAQIIELMNGENFLPRQNSTDNGVFPYQLNLMEMERILEIQSKYYDFLSEKDEEGLTPRDKIISILKYKIPYFVGPLISPEDGKERSKFSWIKRTEEKIYPWNFNKVVDLDETAKNFIYKMLNKCSYLPSNYCLPKNSLIFSYYNVLQVLNKTLINGGIIPKEDKLDMVKNLFMKQRKVSKKDFVNYLKGRYGEDAIISTSNNKEIEEFSCNMASYVDFVNIFGEEYVSNNVDVIENIIRDIVVFEDKSILEKRLSKEYNIQDDNFVKRIKGLTYTKYARISKELLTDIKYFDEASESSMSIIKIMENTNQNLQEVIFNEEYGFETKIYNYNVTKSSKGDYNSIEEYVNDLGAISSGMKRPLIQAYKICEELEKIVGQPIDEYYVECTRSNKEKKSRKSSRYETLKTFYEEASKILKDDLEFRIIHEKLKNTDPQKFQSDKYYLYFTQMGKCMYSGEPIDLEDLYDVSKYDIDHIIPRSVIKDDSFTNRVLVKQKFNKQKRDTYPIPQSILFNGNYNAAYKFYEKLKSNKLISNEKYHRLTTKELSETDLAAFVSRQLVNTNQAVKGFINAIKFFKSTDDFKPKIVYSKGENVTDFRHAFDIVKSREANNFHHAHDAYLNIIVGRGVDTHFAPYSQNQYTLKWMHENGLTTNPLNIFFQNKNKTKKNILDSKGNMVWDYDNSITTVKKNIYNRFDILTTTRTYLGNDFFKKVTIYPKGVGNISVNDKLPVDKYGGFTGCSFGSYTLIKTNNKYILEAIPTMVRNRTKEYLEKECGYSNYEIVLDKIKINTIFESEDRKYAITGKQNDGYVLINKIERFFTENQIRILKKVEKLIEKLGELKVKVTGKETLEEISKIGFYCDEEKIIVSPAANEKTQAVMISNDELNLMYESYVSIYQKDIYNYSACKNIAKSLIESKAKFEILSIFGKVKIISSLNDLLKCNERKTIDLSLIGLKSSVGVLYLGKSLSNCKIVYESITGFYRKVIIEIK